MKLKNAAVIAGSLALILGTSSAFAAYEEGQGELNRGPSQEIREAIDNNDYDAWQSLVSERENSPFAEANGEDVFATMVEIHAFHEAGDREAARALHKELATELGFDAKIHGKHMKHHPRSEAVRDAIEANDFAAWQAAVIGAEKSPFAEIATQDVFDTLVEMHSLHEAGDKEGARELREQLRETYGLEKPEHKRGKRFSGERGGDRTFTAAPQV